jgi:hypothetical protein
MITYQASKKKAKGKKISIKKVSAAHIEYYITDFCHEQNIKIHDGFFRSFHRYMYYNEEFCFEATDLDLLTKTIPTFGIFNSWDEFAKTYGASTFAIDAEPLRYTYFSKLQEDQRQGIIARVEIAFGFYIAQDSGSKMALTEQIIFDAINMFIGSIKEMDRKTAQRLEGDFLKILLSDSDKRIVSQLKDQYVRRRLQDEEPSERRIREEESKNSRSISKMPEYKWKSQIAQIEIAEILNAFQTNLFSSLSHLSKVQLKSLLNQSEERTKKFEFLSAKIIAIMK